MEFRFVCGSKAAAHGFSAAASFGLARLSHCVAPPYCLQYLGANDSEERLMWRARLGWLNAGMQEIFPGSRCAELKRTCARGLESSHDSWDRECDEISADLQAEQFQKEIWNDASSSE